MLTRERMSCRLGNLTPEQEAQLPAHAAHWTRIGLATGPADRAAFEAAARRCYELARVPWHGNVVWVSSPFVLAQAASLLGLLIRWQREGRGDGIHQGLACPALRKAACVALRAALKGAQAAKGRPRTGWQPQSDLGDGELQEALSRRLRAALCETVRQSRYQTGTGPKVKLRDALDAAVQPHLRAHVGLALLGARLALGPVGRAVEDAVHEDMQAMLAEVVSDTTVDRAVKLAIRDLYGIWGGQLEAGGGAAHTSFFREVCTLALDADLWERSCAYEQTVQSACWWFPHPDALLVCERPCEIHLEPTPYFDPWEEPPHRLHRAQGPAVVWPDGWGVQVLHGCRLPRWIAERPEAITPKVIERESNAELRRIMLDLYGWPRYIADCGATIVDSCPEDHAIVGLRGARLLRKKLPGEPEPIVYLEMVNSTADAGGAPKRYLERIDPKAYKGAAARSCHAAMASRWRHRDDNGELQLTFKRWRDYQPAAES